MLFPVLHEDAFWSTLHDVSAIRKEKQEMATTHKCDRCGTVTDDVYIFSETIKGLIENMVDNYELCKECREKIKKWLSDPYIDMVHTSRNSKRGLKEQFMKKDKSEELSCFDRWKLEQFGGCLCDLHE